MNIICPRCDRRPPKEVPYHAKWKLAERSRNDVPRVKKHKKRKMSASARRKISQAQHARWDKVREMKKRAA